MYYLLVGLLIYLFLVICVLDVLRINNIDELKRANYLLLFANKRANRLSVINVGLLKKGIQRKLDRKKYCIRNCGDRIKI